MNIRLLGPIPPAFYVAVSGGPDSMALLSYLARHRPSKGRFNVVHVVMPTLAGKAAEEAVRTLCASLKIPYACISMGPVFKSLDNSDYHKRVYKAYIKCLNALTLPVMTAHHLDDCVDEYLFSAVNGLEFKMPYLDKNIIRPFLTTPRSLLMEVLKLTGPIKCVSPADSTSPAYHHVRALNWLRVNALPPLTSETKLRAVVKKKVLVQYLAEENSNKLRAFAKRHGYAPGMIRPGISKPEYPSKGDRYDVPVGGISDTRCMTITMLDELMYTTVQGTGMFLDRDEATKCLVNATYRGKVEVP